MFYFCCYLILKENTAFPSKTEKWYCLFWNIEFKITSDSHRFTRGSKHKAGHSRWNHGYTEFSGKGAVAFVKV